MKRLVSARWWADHWPLTLVYIFVCVVFVFTVATVNDLRSRDVNSAHARAEDLRLANYRFCESSNERVAVVRDFMLAAVREPDPRQFDFITDPALRAGALEQARSSRAELRQRVEATFLARDCAKDFPPLPPDK